jgi:2-isopropylmalate synthase
MNSVKITTLDTTLRDGAQSAAVSFSVEDKIKIVQLLDELGIDLIEAGNPSSNIKDAEFFKRMKDVKLNHSRLVAFGSTRRVNSDIETDALVKALLSAETEYVSIFGKAWDLHVTDILKTTLEENLSMIRETIEYCVAKGRKVVFDAEHYYDGYKRNPEYAIEVIKTASLAGADVICLCDTNGGCFPDDIYNMTKAACEAVSCEVGIHSHDDSGLAVANALMAVKAGAKHVQGTLNGIGERCGNANLSAIIANLQLKRQYNVIDEPNMKLLTEVSRAVAEISNISVSGMPYISKNAFSHKAGMHIDGVRKKSESFEHVDPSKVGNERSFLVSEVAGKSAILPVIRRVDPTIDKDSDKIKEVIARLKTLEFEGYQFEAAEASLYIVITEVLGLKKRFFDIERFRIMIEQDQLPGMKEDDYASAIVKVRVGDDYEITAADSSSGPVNAIDIALRKSLERFYPSLSDMRLTDYKVRVLDTDAATGARVRVLVESTDGKQSWTTVGVSKDVIMASQKALVDSIVYKLLQDGA